MPNYHRYVEQGIYPNP